MNSGEEKKAVSDDSVAQETPDNSSVKTNSDFQEGHDALDDDGFISVNQAQQTSSSDESLSESNDSHETLDKALSEAQAKADDNWDKYVRLNAEMENLTRRKDKQIEDAHKYAVKNFAEGLLPVIDSLELGLSANGDLESIRKGMELTLKQFADVLAKFDLVAVSPEGDKFNPELHQAMAMQPSPDHQTNDVITVMQKGYTLNGRLIRPAMVVVCKN